MILNAYAVLDVFVTLLRLVVGLLVLGLGLSALWAWLRGSPAPEDRKALEDRCYLLFLLAGFELALNVVSWPIFYLLLQSYVTEWRDQGVMCIYGVTQIGIGSFGPSSYLPSLVSTLQVTKPALVFLSGAWFVLYLVNRKTRTAPLTGRVLLLLLTAGVLAVADASAEGAYVVIPKKEVFYDGGCCTEVFDAENRVSRFLPNVLFADNDVPWLYGTYYAVNVVMILTLLPAWLNPLRFPWWGLLPVLLIALLSLVVNAVFLIEVAAPRLYRKPHHCPYDLVMLAPESLLAVAMFVWGCYSVGWACVVGWLGKKPEVDYCPYDQARPAPMPAMMGQLLSNGFLGYLGSLLMLSVELVVATKP